MKEQDQAIDFSSLPETKKRVDEAYEKANKMLRQMHQIGCYRMGWTTFGGTISLFVSNENEDIDEEQIMQEETRLYKVRLDHADRLDEMREALSPMKRELGLSYRPLVDLLDTCLPKTVGKISINDKEMPGRFAFFFFYSLSIAVEDWARRYAVLLRSKIKGADLFKARQWVEDANESFPFSDETYSKLWDRLLLERSIAIDYLPKYRELTCPSGTTITTPQGRKKTEKNPETIKTEKSYLSLLAEYEKWQKAQRKKTGRTRFGPGGWLEAQNLWSSKSKTFFRSLCGKDLTASEILTNAIKYARKIDREQNSGD